MDDPDQSNVVMANIDGNRDEWLRRRTKGIGGSEAATIMGQNPFGSIYDIWLEKIGEKEPEELTSAAVTWGRRLEGAVAQHFDENNPDIMVKETLAMFQHPDQKYIHGTPDRKIVHPEKGWGILEIKTTSQRMKALWDEHMPKWVYIQLQHYLLITGYTWGKVAVLIGTGADADYREFEVERDDETILWVEDACRQFWHHNVMGENEPELDGSDSAADYLEEKYEGDGDLPVRELDDPESRALLRHYDDLKDEKDQIEEMETEVKNKLKEKIGDHPKAHVKMENDDKRTVIWEPRTREYVDVEEARERDEELVQSSDFRYFRIF